MRASVRAALVDDRLRGLRERGAKDKITEQSLAAFQRHYRASKIDGIADEETCGLIYGLLQD